MNEKLNSASGSLSECGRAAADRTLSARASDMRENSPRSATPHGRSAGSETLTGGAQAAQFSEWQSIQTAPRDGTLIEIRNSYGIAPWYDIFRWHHCGDARDVFEWQSVRRAGHSIMQGAEPFLSWRPFSGNIDFYTDPSHGAQDTPQYWRQAVARKYNLPKNYFEPATGWWGRILKVLGLRP
jgi:hypothetical protein